MLTALHGIARYNKHIQQQIQREQAQTTKETTAGDTGTAPFLINEYARQRQATGVNRLHICGHTY